MNITKDTKLKELLKAYPWLIDDAVAIDPAFRALRSPLARALIVRADVAEAAKKVGVTPDEVIEKIEELIAKHAE